MPFVGTTAAATALGHLDSDEHIVEEILSRRGERKNHASMEFFVHWHGYGTATDSWDPWRVAVLHAYLRNNNLEDEIPRQFRAVP